MEKVIQTSSQRPEDGAATNSREVAVSSDSLSLLQKSFKATEKHAQELKDRFEEKKVAASMLVTCGGCGKKMKSKTGLKRHWTAKGNECSEKDGFKEVQDVEVTPDDRMTESDKKMARMLAAAREAQRQVNPDYHSRHKTSDGMDAAKLMRYPIGNFDRALKDIGTPELEKFIQMRFDRNTAPKKLLAKKELEARLKKQG